MSETTEGADRRGRDAGDPVGSVGEEAAKLLSALHDWAKETGTATMRTRLRRAASGLADGLRDSTSTSPPVARTAGTARSARRSPLCASHEPGGEGTPRLGGELAAAGRGRGPRDARRRDRAGPSGRGEDRPRRRVRGRADHQPTPCAERRAQSHHAHHLRPSPVFCTGPCPVRRQGLVVEEHDLDRTRGWLLPGRPLFTVTAIVLVAEFGWSVMNAARNPLIWYLSLPRGRLEPRTGTSAKRGDLRWPTTGPVPPLYVEP